MAAESRPSKLTLRIDSRLIERAKRYAHERGTSVSQMVADYFQAVTREEEVSEEDWENALGPLTRSLVGVIAGSDLDEADYRRHLEEKHLGVPGERDAS